MKRFDTAPRRGFTLIELLVSIAVIAMLAGLFFPALNLIRQKSWDTAARELCVQTAASWDQLQITHRRFPDRDLVEWCANKDGGDNESVNGDIAFPMRTHTTSLLNWWKPTHPLPQFDLKNFQNWLKTAARGNKEVDFDDWDKIEDWPNDLLLERSIEQKKWGLVAPWASRYIKNAESPASVGEEGLENVVAATVWVMLDMDGDGKVSPPPSLGAVALGPDGEPLLLPKSVIAWVYSDPKQSKVVTTW